jgi:ergothioneine biosynthesis protein EgtB
LKLVEPLTPEDHMVQSMPEASPAKWHIAHTTWFFETFILVPHVPGYVPFDERFGFLFNSYYKQLGNHPYRGVRGTFSRPSLDEIYLYRSHIDEAMHKLSDLELSDLELSAELLRLIELGLNHEQQHQELIVTDIKHGFWTNPLRPSYQLGGPKRLKDLSRVAPLTWRNFDGGIYEVGHDLHGFAFDNESSRHKTCLQAFSLASRLVTNGEYLAFMNDEGYRRAELWLSDAWDRICANRWTAPLYWEQSEQSDNGWVQFTCSGMEALQLDEPVCHISFYEADAYARWAQARLPTEFEWEIAAQSVPDSEKRSANLLEQEAFHPLTARQTNDRPEERLLQIYGDTWEWTSSPYTPYPGYRPRPGAEGEYNGKFMCNQIVLRGGSCATPRSHIRSTYRNFFPPEARWQFSGIRLAHDCA